ncbi:HIT family protein [Candidatus Woesearchaeota archaeon]|nr:HIT family protein [Candidatus Woesearchaeota archaeon]
MVCIFCDFASGRRKKHTNGFPFGKLHETKDILAFLSVDFPVSDDGHTIIIPKRHFSSLEDTPEHILAGLIKEIKLVSSILLKNNKGTNILLNNGKSAGQKIMHLHFHVIPRNPGDGVDIENFRRKKLSLRDFAELHKKIKGEF